MSTTTTPSLQPHVNEFEAHQQRNAHGETVRCSHEKSKKERGGENKKANIFQLKSTSHIFLQNLFD